MARFHRIRSREEEEELTRRRQNLPTHGQINSRMQDSFKSTVGGGLSSIVQESVMSGFRVIIYFVALVIALWFLATL
ncbi:hypothetical protein A6M27_19910 [Acidithiobacillus thiooxidans]|uniref:Uncharacterized protein n=1 Tax=Acidithiobacillus thiooxidans TaxID=930 RepID=A0A1C2I0Z7_ACITH|nr:hypothetical protein [Acidithiobacillus thiooxidans]OCX69623.1 hypothetical protein A6O24_18070 [Acidithiobacillus thiooxidans]OCX72601.1 hypothetical protein A6P07_09540 [Acidithiobacillus thiooxidans]OCX77529.1 hypothetical protein A6O26_19900 [Acidithiobacillus thiooxidans]OCX81229.1 hypothetical protein A6M27_19910 [Acidithiobacillus thiooxidans]OFC43272.1 hypothetical protein BAE47_13190 [Acidithiobacillus thiooxidans]